jgi:hypothetical protein
MNTKINEILKTVTKDLQPNLVGAQDLPEFIELCDTQQLIEYLESMPSIIRTNPHCICDDPNCPHKSPVSPMALYCINERIKQHSRVKPEFFEKFVPSQYPIVDYKDSEEFNKMAVSHDFYSRGRYDANSIFGDRKLNSFHKYNFPIPKNEDTIEGFEFNMNEEIHKIELVIGCKSTELNIQNNGICHYVMLNNFYIPMKDLVYHTVSLNITIGQLNESDENKPFNCKVIAGYFYNVPIKKYIIPISPNMFKNSDNDILCVTNGMGMFGKRSDIPEYTNDAM